MSKNHDWPKNCIWPEPIWNGDGYHWDEDEVLGLALDDDCEDLLEIKEYFDRLVEEGQLNEDYTLNESCDSSEDDNNEQFYPEIGEAYWDDGFDLFAWEEDLSYSVNLLKIPVGDDFSSDPIVFFRDLMDYEFINENLLRQALTRRSFAVQYGLRGCGEELEFIGDSVLNTIVTREITQQLLETMDIFPESPFISRNKEYHEGDLTKIRASFISKEYLALRAKKLGINRFILYGVGESPTAGSLEDAVEALIGAVAIDSGWDWKVLEKVVDRLIRLQLSNPDEFLKKTYYEILNSWHQRRFGSIPSYDVIYNHGSSDYSCTIRFEIPENDKKIWTSQLLEAKGKNRSDVRERAAFKAYCFIVDHGLWINLKESGITPDLENSINQLQELFQKKYLDEAPEYEFEHWEGDEWNCICRCNGIDGVGRGIGKTRAKKEAAYQVLVRLFKAAQ